MRSGRPGLPVSAKDASGSLNSYIPCSWTKGGGGREGEGKGKGREEGKKRMGRGEESGKEVASGKGREGQGKGKRK